MAHQKLTGTGVALVTPFQKDGSIDYAALEKLVNNVIKGGVDFLVALGTTGETPTLSTEEKKDILKAIIKYNKIHNNGTTVTTWPTIIKIHDPCLSCSHTQPEKHFELPQTYE